jgi:hypothetical protein
MSHELYRHFAADGSLLYVGKSLSAVWRLIIHRSASHWFSEIASITITHYATKDELRAAERDAIATENPKYNRRRPNQRLEKVLGAEAKLRAAINQLVSQAGRYGDDDLLHTVDLARVFGCSKNTLEIMRREGNGPPFLYITSSLIRYRRGAVVQWLRERATHHVTNRALGHDSRDLPDRETLPENGRPVIILKRPGS